jgi:altronate dehydratase large subunit
MKIQGYRRENGKVGIRNHVAILPSSICASETAVRISNLVPGTVALPHQHGCCQVGADSEQTINTLIGLGSNPNVAKVLVVGLGCEGAEPLRISEEIKKTGKEVQMITIQNCGGTLKTIEEGARIARKMITKVAMLKKEEIDISELTLAIECGGTDTTSGLCANPAVGTASDILLSHGGTAMLSETTELIGAEHVLANRAVSSEVKEQKIELCL